MNFQTYPYIGPNPQTDSDPLGGLNMLVFDEVCSRTLPLDFLSTGSGNWVLPDKSGLVAISGDNFWNHYMFNVCAILHFMFHANL
jgi:hypothetical protein